MGVRVSQECLAACAGCEVSLLDMGEAFLDLAERISLVHMPLLADHKYFGPLGDGDPERIELPRAEVGIVSGGVRTAEDARVLGAMRQSCEVLVALGTCATHGGIPALANGATVEDMLERCYRTSETTDPAPPPDQGVPPMLERVYALDEMEAVDLYLPGCPPPPGHIAEALSALIEGRRPSLPGKSVCDTCPTVRLGKGETGAVRRFLANAQYDPKKPLSEMRCLLEQGLVCLGPVTRGGCGDGAPPRCISARVPCRGCFGPVEQGGNQMLDMLNALASNGIAFSELPDKPSLLRFSGAHGRLRPRPARR